MIITKTPFRMSFFGGGTDIPLYFNEYGGAVLSATFDKYCYVNVRHLPRFFDYTTEVCYSKIERVKSVEAIEHPAVREAMKMLNMHELRVTYEADLPARTGLGTSSSFAVGMLNAFHCLKGQYADKRRLANEAIYLERTLCGEAGGWQDQIAAAFGGLNKIVFDRNGYEVFPVIISSDRKKELNDNLLLFFTGFTRFSADIQKDAQSSIKNNIAAMKEMAALVHEAENVLVDKNICLDDFGILMDESWKLKKITSDKVSTSAIDDIYERGKAAGALGGKLLGAGGGGFLLFYVPSDRREAVTDALSDLLHVPFEFENGGTRVVHYSPETYDVFGSQEK